MKRKNHLSERTGRRYDVGTMKMSSDDSTKPVAKTLDAVAKYKHREQNLAHWLFVAACAASGLFLAVLVDWFAVLQHPAARWAGPLIVWSVTGFLAHRAFRFFQSGADRNAAARALDRNQKNSLDQWTTFAALQSDGIGATGSDSMAEAMIRDMAPMCRYIEPAKVDPVPFPRKTLACLIGAIILFITFLGVFSSQGSARLPVRFFAPWAEIPLTRLKETSEPPKAILQGSDILISAEAGGKRPAKIWLEINDSPGAAESTRQLSAAADAAEFSLENVSESIRYRLRGGDAVTPWKDIIVTHRPKLSLVKVTLLDPPYSRRPPKTWNRLPRDLQAVAGSEMLLEFETDLPLAKAELETGVKFKSKVPLEIYSNRFGYQTRLNTDFHFRPVFQSIEGFENKELPVCRVRVIPDRPPEVNLTNQLNNRLLSPHENLEISFHAKDDIGVVSAEAVFAVTDEQGNTREIRVPLDLGKEQGKAEMNITTRLKPGEIGISEKDSVSYSVRVYDGSSQTSAGKKQKSPADPSPKNNMTMRPLQTGKSGQSKSGKIKFSAKEMLNEVEPKEKKLLAIESAFARLKELTKKAGRHTAAAVAPANVPGQRLNTPPLFAEVANARATIKTAELHVADIAKEAVGTPYAFLGIQLQSIIRSYITPADAQLEVSVKNRLRDLAPREAHLKQAENFLYQALTAMESLDSKMTRVRSEVKTDIAMAKMMTMYVAQVEDIPTLLTGGEGTPYRRTPGEVDRAQAEAALKKLDSLKELYRKTAELLEQNPELWKRYMDKSKDEGSVFRDQLEELATRHGFVRSISSQMETGKAPENEVRQLIATHQQQIKAGLVRTLDKSQTWIHSSQIEKPVWLESLEETTYQTLKTGNTDGDGQKYSQDLIRKLDTTIHQLSKAISFTPDQSMTLRLGELKQAKSEAGLVAELTEALHKKQWHKAALYEQANIAHETQQLAGRIELQGAGLSRLGDEVQSLGDTLNTAMNTQLLPALSRSVYHLQEKDLSQAGSAQAAAVESFAACLHLLDQFVNAAIREMDKAAPKASIGGGPKITASTLEELERKLQNEKEMSESFGIPCCRPTNLQVMSDWQRVASCSNPSPSQSPPPPGQNQASNSKPSSSPEKAPEKNDVKGSAAAKQQESEKADDPQESKDSRDGSETAKLARAEAMRQAKTLAAMLSGESTGTTSEDGPPANAVDLPADGIAEIFKAGDSGNDWNRLSSKLSRDILQEKTSTMPEEYRKEIEAYFRNLSKWNTTGKPAKQ
ncbi:MAG: hypothetical protein P1V20_18610 [Verrucomicrobiales bacterium]|nr:hypothetical protein [Verrucomicrobiales bacterium]